MTPTPPIDVTNGMLDAAIEAYHEYGRVEDEGDFTEAMREALEAAVAAHPSVVERAANPLVSTMVPVKVVLSTPDGSKERELGTFNQGVHIERLDPTAPLSIYDTASQPTKNAIARCFPNLGWMVEGDETHMTYWRAHIQAVTTDEPMGLRQIRLVDECVGNAARIRAFRMEDNTPHDLCAAVHAAAELLGTTSIELLVRPRVSS